MWYYIYALYDPKQNRFYIGFSEDLNRRISEHKSGKIKTTSKMSSLELVYYEACLSKKDAMKREKELKTGFGRGYIKRRLTNYLSQTMRP